MAVKKRTYVKDIRVLHIVRAVLFLAGALALLALLRDQTTPINVNFVAKNVLASEASGLTVFAPALKNWFDAPLIYMSAVALIVSGGVAWYRVSSRGQGSYAKELKSANSSLKWLDIGISSAIIIEIVALLSGVSDPATVKMCAGAIVVTAALGWLADRQNAKSKKPDWNAYGISVLSGLLPWLAIGSSLLFTSAFGMIRTPWYSYALAGAVLAGFCALAINQMQYLKKVNSWKQYDFYERNYLGIDILIKAAFIAILIIGLNGW